MPRTYGPYPERGAPRGTANCADVRRRLSETQPMTATLADVCALSTDFPLGMERLLSAMAPGRAARHPLLMVAA